MGDGQSTQNQLGDADSLRIFTTDLNGRLITLQVNPDDAEQLFQHGVGYDGISVPGHARVDDSDKLLIPLAEDRRDKRSARSPALQFGRYRPARPSTNERPAPPAFMGPCTRFD